MRVRRVGAMLGVALIWGVLGMSAGSTTGAWAQPSACLKTPDGLVCPPPQGGMARDSRGLLLCGPGLCLRDKSGQVTCSSRPGGEVIADWGEVLCVGGCVEGRMSDCVTPRP